jgi:hypothetical protein
VIAHSLAFPIIEHRFPITEHPFPVTEHQFSPPLSSINHLSHAFSIYTFPVAVLVTRKTPLNPFVVTSHTPARDLNDRGIIPEGLKISDREQSWDRGWFLGPAPASDRGSGPWHSPASAGVPCGNPVSPAFSQLSGTCSGSGNLCPDPQCHPGTRHSHGSHIRGPTGPSSAAGATTMGKGLSCPEPFGSSPSSSESLPYLFSKTHPVLSPQITAVPSFSHCTLTPHSSTAFTMSLLVHC